MNQNAQSGSSGAFGSGGSSNMRQDTDQLYSEVGGSSGTAIGSAGSTGAGMSSQRPMNTDSDVMGDDEDNTARRR